MILTPEQLAAVDGFEEAWEDPERSQFVIAGYAGTGKTTIIKALVERLGFQVTVAVCTPTGKAAHVLRTKGVEACTLHSLLYYPRKGKKKGSLDFVDNGETMPDLVIVDEASMLNSRMVRDLRKRVRFVCYVGDHGQLEPVIGEGEKDPELMKNPDVRLGEIHRQEKGSEIIEFAYRVRAFKAPVTCGPNAQVIHHTARELMRVLPTYDVLLCAWNESRVVYNHWMRRRLGYATRMPRPDEVHIPKIGERVICLRNNSQRRVYNGMTGVVREIDDEGRWITVDTDDGPRERLPCLVRQFGADKTVLDPSLRRRTNAPTLWDFGYVLTCHKSQGSQWQRVAVLDEVAKPMSIARWRYTAATRASEKLLWITT